MSDPFVTLEEVFAATAVRGASLVPETSGYLALSIGDATARVPFLIEDRAVMLTTEGTITIPRPGEAMSPKAAAKNLRSLLARLLAVSTGTMPGLAAAGRPREESDTGVSTVVSDIEAALIPVNRAAARRALARLARETLKAKAAGKLKARPPQPKAAATVNPEKAPEAATTAKIEPAAKAIPEAEAKPVANVEAQPVVIAKPVANVEAQPVVIAKPVANVEAQPVVIAAPVANVEAQRTAEVQPMAEESPVPVVETKPVAVTELNPAAHFKCTAGTKPVPTAVYEAEPPATVDAEAEFIERLGAPDPTPTMLGMPPIAVETGDSEPIAMPEAHVQTLPMPLFQPAGSLAVLDVAPEMRGAPRDPGPQTGGAAVLRDRPRNFAAFLTPPFPLTTPLVSIGAEPFAPLATPLLPVAEPVVAAVAEPVVAPPVRPMPSPVAKPVAPAPEPAFVPLPNSRADVLLARFGASCNDESSMRKAAACLRSMAGIDRTPSPVRIEAFVSPPAAPKEVVALPPAAPPPAAPPPPAALERERPRGTLARRRRGRSGAAVSLALAGIVVGVLGGGLVVRQRPDLFARRADPVRVSPPPAATPGPLAPPRKEAASEVTSASLPAPPTAPPAFPPARSERVGGSRAERNPRGAAR